MTGIRKIVFMLVVFCIMPLYAAEHETNTTAMAENQSIGIDSFHAGVIKWFGYSPKETYKKSVLYSMSDQMFNEKDRVVYDAIDNRGNIYYLHDSGKVEVYKSDGTIDKQFIFIKPSRGDFGIKVDDKGNVLYYPVMVVGPLQLYDCESRKIIKIEWKQYDEPEIFDGVIYRKKSGKIIYGNTKLYKTAGMFINNFKMKINRNENSVILEVDDAERMRLPLEINGYKYFGVSDGDDSGNLYIRYSTFPRLLSGDKYTGIYEATKYAMIKVSSKGELLAFVDFIIFNIDSHSEALLRAVLNQHRIDVEKWEK